MFKKTEQVKVEGFRVLAEEEESNTEEKWPEMASAINCGFVITLSPTSIWVTDRSFLLNLETYFQKCFGWVLKLSPMVLNQYKLSALTL
jgi:hypothetical protein